MISEKKTTRTARRKGMGTGQMPGSPENAPLRLSARNYFEIITSLLFFFLGLVILIRSIQETGLILGMAVGAAFLAYGIFRLGHIWNYFIRGGPKS
jgi:hypothetical protein